ncbi:glycosyltransferase family 2 protein [Flavobacterium flavipallidum]|uniref:Glycosyltransferase n=1 Tax=Flavobacterium flavipallidum TaxID=3139140 RepID=A0ABU9HK53_9FLAO
MENPLVTIVVVSYNHSKYIKENLDSIKKQSYPNIELIIGDDASLDNSVEVFESWLQANQYSAITNFHKKNTGLATTLNECIGLANGKYIKLIAADDFFHFDYIKNCVALFETTNADLIYTKAYGVDENSKILNEDFFGSPEFKNNKELRALLYNGNFISGAAFIVRKSVYNKIGYYQRDVLLEDYDLVLKMLNSGLVIKYLPQSLLYYRRHDGNITKTKFDLLQAHTIATKIKYDIHFEFDSVINGNILKQLKQLNPNLGLIKKGYYKYKKRKLFYYLLINKPFLIKSFIKLRLI